MMMSQVSEINHRRADALIEVVCAIRLDWDKAGVRKALEAAAKRCPDDYPRLVVVAVAAAAKPTNVTPAVIPLEGPHWHAADASTPDAARTPPKPAWCDCGSYHRPDQPCPERMPERVRADATPHLAAMRALMCERRTAIPTAVKDKLDEAAETAKRHAKEDADA